MLADIDYILASLSKSKFRSSFHLAEEDMLYIEQNGDSIIRNHAYDFISKRLKPAVILNDGKQTPYKGHPVFIAEHATATCCRNCLYKWYKIPNNLELTDEQVKFVVDIIMAWINKEMNIKK